MNSRHTMPGSPRSWISSISAATPSTISLRSAAHRARRCSATGKRRGSFSSGNLPTFPSDLKTQRLVLAALGLMAAVPASAWGDLGHQVTALIAYRHLLPQPRARLDALLASDGDPLTAPDFASRATWADKYRNSHRETAAWHFVDIEIDHPDLSAACFGFPALGAGQAASAGPANDCVVDKIDAFERELGDPATLQAERILALKFLMHFVGDMH